MELQKKPFVGFIGDGSTANPREESAGLQCLCDATKGTLIVSLDELVSETWETLSGQQRCTHVVEHLS